VCVRCRRSHPLFGVNFDHRKNRSQGGLWSASNGQLMCGSGTVGCHGHVTQNPAEALREGWSVPSWADPASWPAARWFRGEHGIFTRGFVLYDDEGRFREITADEAARITDGMVA